MHFKMLDPNGAQSSGELKETWLQILLSRPTTVLTWQDAPEGSPVQEITFIQPSHA